MNKVVLVLFHRGFTAPAEIYPAGATPESTSKLGCSAKVGRLVPFHRGCAAMVETEACLVYSVKCVLVGVLF